MSKLREFIDEVEAHPNWEIAVSADRSRLEALAEVEAFFAELELHADPRCIDLYDAAVRIVCAKDKSIGQRLNELHELLLANLPWLKAANKRPGTRQ